MKKLFGEYRDFISQGNVVTIAIGLVIQAVIMFLVVAFILLLIVKAYNTYVAKPEEGGPTELDVLTEIRDELRASRGG